MVLSRVSINAVELKCPDWWVTILVNKKLYLGSKVL